MSLKPRAAAPSLARASFPGRREDAHRSANRAAVPGKCLADVLAKERAICLRMGLSSPLRGTSIERSARVLLAVQVQAYPEAAMFCLNLRATKVAVSAERPFSAVEGGRHTICCAASSRTDNSTDILDHVIGFCV